MSTIARALLLTLLAAQASAQFAPCPASSPGTDEAPASRVYIWIQSVRPNSDMEGDDDYIPGYDNHADIYGRVMIDGVAHALRKRDETDFPHWDETGAFNGRFEADAVGGSVSFRIEVAESDSGLTGDDDLVDINPAADAAALEFELDLCSLHLSGDVVENGVARIEVSRHAPSVRLEPIAAVTQGASARLRWRANDRDGDRLTYAVQITPERRVVDAWWPAAQGVEGRSHALSTAALTPGRYLARVIAHDGLRARASAPVPFEVRGRSRLRRQAPLPSRRR